MKDHTQDLSTQAGRDAELSQIQQLLSKLISPYASNEPALGVNLIEMQRAANNGFPRHMYHAVLPPQVVINKQQEQMLAERGYKRTYIFQSHPKWKFRRNLSEKFSKSDYVEGRIAKTPGQEAELLKQRVPPICGPWLDSPTDIEPLPQDTSEEKDSTIARLEGALEESRRKTSTKSAT